MLPYSPPEAEMGANKKPRTVSGLIYFNKYSNDLQHPERVYMPPPYFVCRHFHDNTNIDAKS